MTYCCRTRCCGRYTAADSHYVTRSRCWIGTAPASSMRRSLCRGSSASLTGASAGIEPYGRLRRNRNGRRVRATALHRCVAPLRCTTALRHCVAPLRCTTALHYCVAPLRCTTALHHCVSPLLPPNHCHQARLPTTAAKHSSAPPPPTTAINHPPLRHRHCATAPRHCPMAPSLPLISP